MRTTSISIGRRRAFRPVGRAMAALVLAAGQTIVLLGIPAARATSPADVTVQVANKTYDGTTDATVTGCTVTTDVGTDVVLCDETGITAADFADENVGSGKSVSITTGAPTLTGADAGNWTLGTVTVDTANISAAVLTAILTADNKSFDGTTDATGTCSVAADTDLVSGETVTCTVDSASFDTPSKGTDKTVTATVSLGGGDAGNYALASTSVTDLADISAAVLTAVLTANDKAYDSTTTAAGTCSVAADPDLVSGDDVTCVVDSATFDTAAAGTGKTVTATVSLAGADAADYSLASTSPTDFADITALTLTGVLTAADKVYDGTDTASATCDVSGDADLIMGDDVTCSVTTASFDSASAGTGKTVTATVSLTGADAGGYVLDSTSITDTADITPAPLGILFTGNTYFSGASVGLQATVSGPCKAGQTVTFILDSNTADGNFDNETPIGTATTNSAGVATLAASITAGTVVDLEVSVADTANCTGAVGTTVIVVAGTGDASNGGGSYNNGGRMNFGYTVQVKTNLKTGAKTVSGQILWQKQGDSRFKGVVTGFTTVTCPSGYGFSTAPVGTTAPRCALITGSGSTYTWNAGTGNWDLNVASTAFRVLVMDGGTSTSVCSTPKKCSTVQNADYIGIYFPYATVVGESTDSAGYPYTYVVKGGSLTVK